MARETRHTRRSGIVARLAAHRVGCNLLMVLLLLAGAFALQRLGTQFFPTFSIDFASIQVRWPGAAAEDVDAAVTAPLERELRGLGDSARDDIDLLPGQRPDRARVRRGHRHGGGRRNREGESGVDPRPSRDRGRAGDRPRGQLRGGGPPPGGGATRRRGSSPRGAGDRERAAGARHSQDRHHGTARGRDRHSDLLGRALRARHVAGRGREKGRDVEPRPSGRRDRGARCLSQPARPRAETARIRLRGTGAAVRRRGSPAATGRRCGHRAPAALGKPSRALPGPSRGQPPAESQHGFRQPGIGPHREPVARRTRERVATRSGGHPVRPRSGTCCASASPCCSRTVSAASSWSWPSC